MSTPEKVMAPCPSCGAKLSVPSTAAGKKIRCPKCQTVVAITADMVNQPPEMVAPLAAVPKQVSGPEVSLSDENTFAGAKQKKYAPESLGDQATFGGKLGSDDAVIDDDMEIVDLTARYTIESTLGKGGMGEVQLATDNRLKRKVAIKRVLGDMAKSQTAVRRFMTEAQSIAALNHPNIVQVYDYGRDKTGPFLILEYVDGKSLLERCQEGAIPLEEAVDLTCQVCDGLGKAHDAGIIHRDLKPANVLLTKDGVPKLTDFGLARVETGDTGQTMSGAVLGTLDFMPPEQRRDATQADARSDLWSLAATLYQMVTGKTPKIIKFKDVPQSLQDVLGKALEDAKDDRYQTAREFKEALRASLQTSAHEVADLGEGQCLSCGTKNEGHRKFCKECAVSLRVHCFSCNVEIPVWDKVCSECGTKQAALLESRRHAMTGQQSQAESLLKNYDFDQATSLAVALRDEPDPRLQQLKGWSKLFVEQIETARRQQLERIGTLLSEALQHETASDYSSAIHTLEQVPEILRGTSIPGQSLTPQTLLKRLTETQSEVHRLDELIRQRGSARHLNGLHKEVDRLLELCPDRSDLQTLKEQLADRDTKLIATREESIATAQRLVEDQDYAGAIKALAQVDAYVQTEEVTQLADDASKKLARLEELHKTIKEATAAKQLHGLLKQVDECLSLKSDDEEMRQLQARLRAREEKNAAQLESIVQKASSLRDTCQFANAVKTLARIPQELITDTASDLLEFCQSAAVERSNALDALWRSQTSEDYRGALTAVKTYSDLISRKTLKDEEFLIAFQSCQQAWKEQKGEEEASIKRKAFQLKMLIGTSAVIAVGLLVAAGLLIRSSQNASALAAAVTQQQWEEALAIDGQHVPALIGRATQRLNAGPPDIEGAFADLGLAEQVNSTVAALNPAKALAYAKRATAQANTGTISDAEKDLQQAVTLGASDSQLSVVRQSLAAAYVKQAEAAAQSGTTPQVIASATKAVEYDESIVLPPAVVQVFASHSVEEFEQASTVEHQTAALTALSSLESIDAQNVALPVLRKRVTAVLLKRSQATITSDLSSASSDYNAAIDLGASASESETLKVALVTALTMRCRESLAGQDVGKALADYSAVAKLDSQGASPLIADFEKLPASALSALPPSVFVALPPSVLVALPPIQNSVGMAFKLLPSPHGAFSIGVYEVTQQQYEAVMGSNPSEFKGANNPVENVSWDDAVAYCAKLSSLPAEVAAGHVYRLPTAAEWEYACRAGTTTEYSFGDDEKDLGKYAWFLDNSLRTTHGVGEKLPNGWGLYDMHGNAWEWCSDAEGSLRVLRGGSWNYSAGSCRSAFRGGNDPSYRSNGMGFRLALSADFVNTRSLSPAADGQAPTPERLPSEMPEVPNLLASSAETSKGENSAKFPALIGPGQPIGGTQRSAQGGGSQMTQPVEAGGASKLGGVGGPGDTTFMDVSAIGKTFVYVIDTSSSMSGGRLKLAQSQLKKSLRLLQPNQQFGVIFYNEYRTPLMLPRQGDRVMHYATEFNKLAASHSIDRIRGDAGTEHKAALLEALRLKSDVIYFLTDGDEPELSPADLREIAKQTGKTTIHVIKFGDSAVESRPTSWLEKLAAQSYGEFRPIKAE